MSQTIRGDEEFAKLLHNRGGKWGARYDWQNKSRLIDLLITAHYYKNSVRKITVNLVEQKKTCEFANKLKKRALFFGL